MKRLTLLFTAVVALFTVAARAEEELSFDFFYDQLAPYGEWEEVADYGYVWHPADVAEDWAPYTDGYWSYTDAGWTWVSYEDFGGITYHYGRWVQIEGTGWCWVPDYEWGPAWVSWRKNDDYVGWAPLPPEARWEVDTGFSTTVDVDYDIGPLDFHFCRVRDFGAPVIREVCVPRERNVTIVYETVNITNVCYREDYGCVFNGGFDYDWIAPRCERPLPALRLVRNTTNIFIIGNRGNIFLNAPRGNALIVGFPHRSIREDFRLPSRKIQVAHVLPKPVFHRGWTGLDKEAVRDRLLLKMREEHRGLPAKSPARPVRAAQIASLPQAVDLAAPAVGKVPGHRAGTVAKVGASIPVDAEAIKNPARVPGDRNHDGKPDRPSRVPGDRNGDGKPDRVTGVPGDVNGDGKPDRVVPVPGDRNGDGKPDRVVPVPGDRNNDGKPDRVVPTPPERVRPIPGDRNNDGKPDRVRPVPGDRNGDGKPDKVTGDPGDGRPDGAAEAAARRQAEMENARQQAAAAAEARERAAQAQRENAANAQRERAAEAMKERNSDAARQQAAAAAEARERAAQAQRENAAAAQRDRAAAAADARERAAQAQRDNAANAQRERAADAQRQQQAAAAAEARQRNADAQREQQAAAMRERAADAQRQQQAAAAAAEARQRNADAAAKAQADAKAQQDDRDDRKKKGTR